MKLSGLEIPSNIMEDIQPIKDDDSAIREYGVNYGYKMCQELLKSGKVG